MELVGGPEKRALTLVEHDPSWADRFDEERARIVAALGPVAVHHIGSTSVPGLAAKPIVDILVAVDDVDDESNVRALEAAGYVLRRREPGHRLLRTPELDVHVHFFPAGTWDMRRHLVFAAWLRRNREDRDAYESLKRSLIARDWATMNDYAEAKGDLIGEIVGRAETWAAATGWTPDDG